MTENVSVVTQNVQAKRISIENSQVKHFVHLDLIVQGYIMYLWTIFQHIQQNLKQ